MKQSASCMRIAFMGSPDFSVPALRALYERWAHDRIGLLPAAPASRPRAKRYDAARFTSQPMRLAYPSARRLVFAPILKRRKSS